MPCESGEHGAWSARDIRVRQPLFGSKDTRHGDQIEVEFQTPRPPGNVHRESAPGPESNTDVRHPHRPRSSLKGAGPVNPVRQEFATGLS